MPAPLRRESRAALSVKSAESDEAGHGLQPERHKDPASPYRSEYGDEEKSDEAKIYIGVAIALFLSACQGLNWLSKFCSDNRSMRNQGLCRLTKSCKGKNAPRLKVAGERIFGREYKRGC